MAGNYKGENPNTVSYVQKGLKDGLYVGAQVGYDSYKARENFSLGTSFFSGNPTINATGWVGGLFLGYGRYFNNVYYLGSEIFGNDSGANDQSPFSLFTIINGSSKISARGSYGLSILPGIKLNDNTLGYIRLGYNWVSLKTEGNVSSPGSNLSYSKTNTSHGFNYGLGIETLIYDNWSIRTEYSHTDYSSYTVTASTAGISNATTKTSPANNQFMLGVIYHFA